MSSHVVVLDSTARRATVKTTPGKHLTEILQEACTKLGVDPSQHGLKYKGKELDMSLVFRLSGLTSGAKLELVQSSRSPSVVTVALQLPESEARGAPNGRLMDKFPSTTTIWFILRKFEAGVAGGTSKTRNLTGRGVPSGNEGAGRLYYETPVVQVLQRELCSFADFQKSLAQLGFNSGNVLLRLSFRRTEEPMEQAMGKIQEYFQTSEDMRPKPEEQPTSTGVPLEEDIAEQRDSELEPHPASTPATEAVPEETAPPASQTTVPAPSPSEVPAGFSRPVTVFSPPSGDTPQSAQTTYNEADYIPSVDHAQAHQRRLNAASRPQRLPTDAEIAAKVAAEEEKLAAIAEVEVKVRLPDQSQVVAKFGRDDTGRALYDFVRNCLAAPFADTEKFTITYLPVSSAVSRGGSARKIQEVIPDSDRTLLIRDLGLAGRVLVNFSWDASASQAAHSSRELLKPELRTRAQEIKVEQPPDVMETAEDVRGRTLGATGSSETKTGEKRKPGGIPKWLKLPGKK
ncbi:putative UBX domain protein [Aspergillus saccharolyticus JOP 1030-1]|uniref:UBX domain protein n=1 Tax=Aspergillus saccharolyticus JOP 1030-1 TaxID=1450539 RepID=A0A318ZTZ1_9EURO|nr:UBX domain protein [Aspergillus saccharolyticus JOP 1030-1]PYH47460.1 UBX domain protein [Aspergillus saccharolyticus JOP 1030-1]